MTVNLAKLLIDSAGKVPCVLDIGANLGTFAVPITKYIEGRNGSVHCFEPQRPVSYQLSGNIFLNRIDNAYVHRCAIFNKTGREEILVVDYSNALNIGAYSLIQGMDDQQKALAKESVEVYRIDDFAPISSISLGKLDVEGMELEALEGCSSKLSTNGFQPILFESLVNDPRASQVSAFLVDLGYSCTQYANEGWLAQHREWEVS